MAKSAEERFDILVEAYNELYSASLKMAEAGVLNSGTAKALNDMSYALGTVMKILDPDRYEIFARAALAEVHREAEKQAAEEVPKTGYVGEDRPGYGMYL